jgi:molecular chaperone GrpE
VIDNKEVDESHEVTDETSPEAAGDGGPAIGGVPAEPAESAVKRLEEQHAELQERHLRLAAEFDNYRKRVARERLELVERAQASLLVKMVDILDDMDRLVAADPTGTVDTVHQGMIMVDRKLRKELEAAGLERLDPAGEPFDPTVHEAVAVTPPQEPSQAGLVSATFQVGYRFKGHLVRAARVQVYSAEGSA